jgi:alanine racemase
VEVARTALDAGADMLAVARLDEGLALRQAGVAGPILVFGPTPPEAAENLVAYDLIQSVTGLAPAQALDAVAHRCGSKIPVHLKVDSGMGRLGLLPDNPGGGALTAAAEAAAIARLPGLRLEGVYTHFAAADEADKTYAHHQFRVFTAFLDTLQAAGIDPGLRHAANSAAIIDLPETHLDVVRPGIALYGLYPSREVDHRRIVLRPALAVKSRLLQVKAVPAGFKVSYGMTWEAPAPTVIGTVAAGYADGIQRRLSNRGVMLVGGQRVPIVGRVCMDLTMLDLGPGASASPGDEVVLIGRQGEAEVSADEIADRLDTINYEVVFTNATRVPRVYRK